MSSAGFIIAIAIIAGNCWLIGVMWGTSRARPKLGGDGDSPALDHTNNAHSQLSHSVAPESGPNR